MKISNLICSLASEFVVPMDLLTTRPHQSSELILLKPETS
jgi:hypothetical protein